MKKAIAFHYLLALLVFFQTPAKKILVKKNECFTSTTTYRQIKDKPATIREQPAGTFYIVEQGIIDLNINPCNLTADFQVANLRVTISGDVKATVQGGPGPCCSEDFVITKITR